MKNVIIVVEPEGPEEWFAPLEEVGELRFHYPDGGPIRPEQVDGFVDEADCLVITSATAISNAQLRNAKRLKLIAKCGGAPSNIDVSYAAKCGIATSCVPGANTTSIAEYTVMLLISTLRKYCSHTEAIRGGGWRTDALLGRDIGDCTIGIVGLGAIGSAVLRMLQPFGCRVLVNSLHADKSAYSGQCVFYDDIEEMLPLCDAVTVHSKVTPQNRGFFNERLFSLMKKGAIFVNTARGALVDENALARALNCGKLSAAAIDVFQTEPPSSDNPLLLCPNAIITPHSSGWTLDALKRECDGAVRSVLAYFKGGDIPGLLDQSYINYSGTTPPVQ